MNRFLLKPWDLTTAERERVMETMRTMKATRGDVVAWIVTPVLLNLPMLVYLLAQLVARPPSTPNIPLLIGLVLAPLPLVIVLNLRIVRRRVPRAIRLAWEDSGPPVCPACWYRIADLPAAETCPECGEHWIVDDER